MEKFFKPVHSPSGTEDMKPRKHHHHHHLPHHQDPQSHRCMLFDDTDRNKDESHGHQQYHQHGLYHHDSPHHHDRHHRRQTQQFHHSEEDEILYNQEAPAIVPMASSSSLSSSSSSSSFSSWYTEESGIDPFSLHHAKQPLHSLSCSNISDVRRGFREDSTEPIVFATIQHKNGRVCTAVHENTQNRGHHGFAPLDRGHSRSEEGLVQGNESGLGGAQSKVSHVNYGRLYKASSLNRSLTFSEEDFVLGVSRGPKRAVSSSQLPSKGILKNKEPHSDIRKAKSMEVLSPRVFKGQDPSGQKEKGSTQVEVEQARANFVKGKLQFSAFLDEITKQVISPSALTILGVNNDKSTGKTPNPAQTPAPVKPQLPPKKNRGSSGEEREQRPRQHNRQEKAAHSSSKKQSESSNPDKLISYAARNHHGSPPPQHYQYSPSPHHHESSRKDKRLSPTGGSVKGDSCGGCGPQLTDGTSTSPEPIPLKQRRHRRQHTEQLPQHQPQQVHPGKRRLTSSPSFSAQDVGPGLGSESSSTKSDSSRTRDTASTTTSHSLEQSGQHQPEHVGHFKQHRDALCDANHLQVLQEENWDLHQNLLQTVVCIESLEAELQRTRNELSHVKEKYKSLLETHTGTKQANNLLGEHLHIASESLTSERKFLLHRVSELSAELDEAYRTIAALENINVPCLIKELLEKHFDSAETIQKFRVTSAPLSRPATTAQADGQSHMPTVEEASHDWLTKSEAALQRITAFIPFKQVIPTTGGKGLPSAQHSPPVTVSGIIPAISKKMAASYAARPQPLYPQMQKQLPLGTNYADAPNLQQNHVAGESWSEKDKLKVTLLEQDVMETTAISAQQILDDFLQQLQPHKEAGGLKEQQEVQEWVGVAEQTGKLAE